MGQAKIEAVKKVKKDYKASFKTAFLEAKAQFEYVKKNPKKFTDVIQRKANCKNKAKTYMKEFFPADMKYKKSIKVYKANLASQDLKKKKKLHGLYLKNRLEMM